MSKLSKFGKMIRKNRSYILSFLGIGGFIFGTVNSSKVAYMAGQEHRPVKFTELLPTILIDIASAASIITGNVLDSKDKKHLLASYALLTAVQQRYSGTFTKETESIARKAAEDLHLGKDLDEYHYFYDPISEEIFYTDMKTVVGAEYLINRQLSIYGSVDVQDWWWLLGIEVTDNKSIELLDHGWDSSVIEEFFDSPGIEFYHGEHAEDYIATLPDGSIQKIPKEDILDICMSYYPKELNPEF